MTNPTRFTPANGVSTWFQPGIFALLLAVLIAASYPDALFWGKSFVFRDFGIFTCPNAYFQRESFWRGEFPLWNPLNNCGIPFLAQWNTVCLYPLSLIYLLLPLSFGLTLFLLGHLFLAGFGMYLLALQWTKNPLAAVIAGMVFTFNGMTMNCLMWLSNLAALAWMPWVILLMEQAWRAGTNRRAIAAALVAAAQLLAGAPEIIAFTWMILAGLFIGQTIQDQRINGRILLRTICIVVITTLLTMAQLLPFFDLLAHSERTTSYGTSLWTIPLWGWANFFVPLFHCYRAPLGVYFQPTQDWVSSYYIGIAALALAVLAIILGRRMRVWLLAIFAVSGFLVALGEQGYLYPLLLKVFPPLGFMRYPIKFEFLTVFSIPLLAAFGIAQLQNSDKELLARAWKWTVAISMLFIVTIGGILFYAWLRPFPHEHWPLLCANGLMRGVFLALILGAILLFKKIQAPPTWAIARLLLILFFWLDFMTGVPRQNPTVAAPVFQPGLLAQKMEPLPKPGQSRALMTKQSHDVVYSSMLTDTYDDFLGRRFALLGDCNILDDIPVPDGFYSLYIKEQRALFTRLFLSPTNAFPTGLADFLGVSKISDPQNFLAWQSRANYLPFCSIGAKPEFVEVSNTPAFLFAKDFDARKIVFLPPAAKEQLKDAGPANGTIRQLKIEAQRIDLKEEADAPAMLVLSQAYYHPWRASIDGKPTQIFQANYAFQALEVPAGLHEVTLIYDDRAFHIGLFVSACALAGCLFFAAKKYINLP